MRPDIFDAIAPVCPRCLHQEKIPSAIEIATREEMRGDHLWHGILHCTNRACWLEFPVIDGVPIIVPDPATTIRSQAAHVFWRTDLPPALESLAGDVMGPGDIFETLRYHLSLYAADHYAGWGLPGTSGVSEMLGWGLDQIERADPTKPRGVAIDLGGSVGRAGWDMGARGYERAIVADLNLSMLRFGQRLALEGEVEVSLKRTGIAYDRARITVPEDRAAHAPDFWAVDAAALPLTGYSVAALAAINLIDCTAAPAAVVGEIGRVLEETGGVVLATPHDWSPQATEMSQWFGGHSQRGETRGAPEPILANSLRGAEIETLAEVDDFPWRLRLHGRATMEYRVQAVAGQRKAHDHDHGPFG